MVFDIWASVGRVLATAAVVYTVLILALRISGKRTLAMLNAFDVVVTVALGSVLATVLTSGEVPWAEAVAAIAALVAAQFTVSWFSVCSKTGRRRRCSVVSSGAGRRVRAGTPPEFAHGGSSWSMPCRTVPRPTLGLVPTVFERSTDEVIASMLDRHREGSPGRSRRVTG
jgi:hypothetical protein